MVIERCVYQKLNKRSCSLVCLLLCAALVVAFTSAPASAETIRDSFIDVLAYNTPPAISVSSTATYLFSLPGSTSLNYFDSLVSFYGSAPDSFYLLYGTQNVKLNHIYIGSNLYRVYGSLTGHSSGTFSFRAVSSGTSSLNFKSVRLLSMPASSFHCSATGTFYDMYQETSTRLSYTGSTVQVSGTVPNNGTLETTCILSLAPVDYQRFDYIDFYLYFSNVQVDSISGTYNGMSLPLEVSYIYPDSALQSCFYMNVRMDLSECIWVSGSFPSFDVTGNFSYGQPYVVSVNDCTGFVVNQQFSPIVYYFRQVVASIGTLGTNISNWFTDQTTSLSYWLEQIYLAVSGDQGQENPGEQLQNQGQQIQDFEQEHQEVINQGTEVMTNTLNISGFAPALLFVSSTLDSVFGILGPYQVVIILPIVIGMILFICSKVPGTSRPVRSSRSKKG